MARSPSAELSLTQVLLLSLVSLGLKTPYILMSLAGLTVGLTSPALRKMEEEGLLSRLEGPRNRMAYALTETGRFALRSNLVFGRSDYWTGAKGSTYESASRAVLLAWMYFGTDDAKDCIAWIKTQLTAQTLSKEREFDGIWSQVERLQEIEHPMHYAKNVDGTAGSTVRLLDTALEGHLLDSQVGLVENLEPILGSLSRKLQFSAIDAISSWPEEGRVSKLRDSSQAPVTGIYVLRSLSTHPSLGDLFGRFHKISITLGPPLAQTAMKEPIDLFGAVEVVATYKPVDLNLDQLHSMIDRVFLGALLDLDIAPRSDYPFSRGSWYMASFEAIDEGITRIINGTIEGHIYDSGYDRIVAEGVV